MTSEAILAEALKLTYEQRVNLVDLLQRSIVTAPEYKQVQANQKTDLQRRLAELEAGTATLIPGDEVMKRLRRRDGEL